MTVAVVCIALLGLLVVGLGLGVSLTRGSTRTNFGYTVDPTDRLYKMTRAHGNTTEYAPMLAILMLVAAQRNPATWVLWTMGLVTLSRYLFAVGIIVSPTLDQPQPLRFIGAIGTYLFGLMLCIAVLLSI